MDRAERASPLAHVGAIVSGGLLVRLGCAGILLTAAGFKVHQLVTDPALGTLYGSRLLQFFLIEYEVLLASWLLSGAIQKYCRWVALATFAIFAGYAFYLGVTGAASCGCFGRVQVNPWMTLGLDCGALILLFAWRPAAAAPPLPRIATASAIVGVLTAAVVTALVIFPRAVVADGVTPSGSLFVLEPEKWTGKRFPLVGSIDIGDKLSSGQWIVLFYHHDCAKCREAIAKFEHLVASTVAHCDAPQFALIEVPPYGDRRLVRDGGCDYGRLTSDEAWFIVTPCEVRLDGAQVVAVNASDNRE